MLILKKNSYNQVQQDSLFIELHQ